MTNKRVLVLGASSNPERYSYKAVSLLHDMNFDVIAIGNKTGKINDIEIYTEPIHFENIHSISLYLNPTRQIPYYEYIVSLKPKRIIFNPGTESIDLENYLDLHQIKYIEACTLVMLKTNQF